ncbi:MAG: glycosyltransferase [Proteobacteria bacterium]|nr:glycosyltransferase [Pseudomonadota bacterium]
MSTASKISVVIPTYNRKDALFRTLQSLFRQTIPSEDFEIVVVLDGPTDGTLEMLNGLGSPCALRVIWQSNRGQAVARNAGWRAASGKIILFLDDDMLCDSELVHHHLAAHADNGSTVAFGPTPLAAESPWSILTPALQSDTEYVRQRLSAQTEAKFPDDMMVCSNTSLPRGLLETSGGFDERFFRWFEDIDLGIRLYERGVAFRYVPQALARHLFVKLPKTSIENQYWCGRNSVLLCRLHPSLRPYTLCTSLETGSYLKSRFRKLAIRHPEVSTTILGLFYVVANSLRLIPFVQHLAIWLHGVQCRIQFFRGAIEEAGSEEIYQAEFGFSR